MRVGIIRGDMPGPVFLADLEPVSQYNPPTEPRGQERYVNRPVVAAVQAAMVANVGAGFASTGNMAFNVTINAGNQTLRAKTSAGAGFSVILMPPGVYATMAAFLTAMNARLLPYGMALKVSPLSAVRVVLYSLTYGEGSYINIDTVANGSTFNGATAANFGVGGGTFTVPLATAFITATLPVGGPLDVRATTIRTQLGPALDTAQVEAMASTIAPKFVDTDVAVKCYQVGYIADLRSANFNPDPNRLPAIVNGPAVTVVQDDGNTAFSASALAPVPNITNAQLNVPVAGAVTITGVGLGDAENIGSVTVKFTDIINTPSQHAPKLVSQAEILHAGGTVSLTSIVIPASLVPTWAVVTTTRVSVKYTSLASNTFALV
jgi:hypothetical protein